MKVDAYNVMDAYDATDTSQNAVKIGIPKITTGTVLLLQMSKTSNSCRLNRKWYRPWPPGYNCRHFNIYEQEK